MNDRATQTLIDTAQSAIPALKTEERTRCEVWTRVMGYHRPVSAFNIGKQGEFKERQFFQERP
ncbi:hypothetical protein HNQ50_003107 [Silvimonas terrae]|uniref:Uncharacterized protein n=1 Tax=Silvimonas terrae TaxID=300266 RepID=A0A840RJ83_9NEIS|nr:anaerobic ribonucleoside-triphosphate reductase [Silvimonas terrae]MBB5192366.1 hypothetical protein [Silvimonas terrae]